MPFQIGATEPGRGSGDAGCAEQPGYLTLGSEQLYYVRHVPRHEARGRVMLAGPFAPERAGIYVPWVRWARFLSKMGFEVLRFDYRGTGESTGRFEEMTLDQWQVDLSHCASWWGSSATGAPLMLHGLGLGALLVNRAFNGGLGQGLLLWWPPASARQLLFDALRSRLATDLTNTKDGQKKTRESYVAQLEAGQLVEVDGYRWSLGLWRSAEEVELDLPGRQGRATSGVDEQGRPWHVTQGKGLEKRSFCAVRTPKPGAINRSVPLNPDLSDFFASQAAFLDACCEECPQEQREGGA